MDTYTGNAEEKMAEAEHQVHPSNFDVISFADNVKLHAKILQWLQHLLNGSTASAQQIGRTCTKDEVKIMALSIEKKNKY